MKFHVEQTSEGILVRWAEIAKAPEHLRKRIHDLRGAGRTMQFCVENLKQGYHFDDDMAAAKIAALEKAQQTIARDLQLVESIYNALLSAE